MTATDVALILLAAGKSRRFGGSKLDALLDDLPLGLHAARTLADIPFARRVAVTGRCAIDYAAEGFTVIPNRDPIGDMASSLRLGIGAVGEVAAALIVLADMPRVTAAHVRELLVAGGQDDAIIASSSGAAPCPPALFGRTHFPALLSQTGDRGARELIRGARVIIAPSGVLLDIDTPDDLARAHRQPDPA